MADPMVVVVAGVIRQGGRVLLCRRKAGSLEGMKWEFPGGKVEPGETPEAALARELREELNISVRVVGLLDAVVHPHSPYPDRGILILYYAAEIAAGRPEEIDVGGIAWAAPAQVSAYELAPADALFAARGKIPGGQSDISDGQTHI